ncbi:MAG: cytochrome c [Alphaproteobacteria bacterium]|nr:cytochrome c [Alphaproteobacteria bacterium]
MNRHLVVAAAGLALALTTVTVQADPIKDRKELFKEWGDNTKPVVEMLKGKEKFDIAVVQKALVAYEKNIKLLPDLFPVGSETGGDTEALAAIWQDKAKFNGNFTKMTADVATAAGVITDEASFKTSFPNVVANCKACHDDFKQKKK